MCVGMISSEHVLDGESSIIFTRSFSVISGNDANATVHVRSVISKLEPSIVCHQFSSVVAVRKKLLVITFGDEWKSDPNLFFYLSLRTGQKNEEYDHDGEECNCCALDIGL
ncbi:hypothetical protein HELRODRAFT_162987 [Helobdella robusta]|uniref:Uncharacterized protein n=1 Tax=Helobdella robusta TaxID=6412 RepID=T1ETH9_HELRO|nr:hypothetical protein HELRODRAFT_162987 [Helobdella robusta]ESN99438.1 hypothetical protein HELRODRAFT_162987 [Helobdella robusta]